jgi:homoserine O-acetyltransferase
MTGGGARDNGRPGRTMQYQLKHPLQMDCGASLFPIDVAYETYGGLNREGTNAVLVCHALTGSAHAADLPGCEPPAGVGPGWWNGIIGKGKAIDTERFFVICSNFLGSCYGTTGPTSVNPATGKPYRRAFPQMTVRDMVRVQHQLLAGLGVRRIAAVLGGSLGGMQVLEWALLYPEMVDAIIPIAAASRHSAWAIGWNEAARLAILSDPGWNNGNYVEQPARGLAVARMIAMISYRSHGSFQERFGRGTAPGGSRRKNDLFTEIPANFQVESYLRYQGEKLVNRFDANAYLFITRAMDLHDVSAGRGSLNEVLAGVKARTLAVGISSDALYPTSEVKELAGAIPGARYAEIDSIHGHDAFLIEHEQLNRILRSFLPQTVTEAPIYSG